MSALMLTIIPLSGLRYLAGNARDLGLPRAITKSAGSILTRKSPYENADNQSAGLEGVGTIRLELAVERQHRLLLGKKHKPALGQRFAVREAIPCL